MTWLMLDVITLLFVVVLFALHMLRNRGDKP